MVVSKKISVLIADDDPLLRALLKEALTSMNADVVGLAQNGHQAVEIFRKYRPDILLLDNQMPLKNGYEALQEILQEFPDAFVLMLTGDSGQDRVQEFLAAGAAAFIPKNISILETKRKIKQTWEAYKKSRPKHVD